jgi:hypothetical protein
MSKTKKLPLHTLRKIATESEACEASVVKVFNGRTIRGAVDGRVRRVLEAHGIVPANPTLQSLDSTPKSVA